jgi:DNA modification methylase
VINISPVITPRLSRSHQSQRHPIPFDLHPLIQDIGWEFIEDIIWVKPETSVKKRNGIFSQYRKPLTYKPNIITEYILVYRKKTSKLIDWNLKQYDKSIVEESKILDDYETNNVWYIHPKANKLHPAVFPDELAEKVIKYYSFKNDLILDPFCGSGTTCRIAKKLNRNYLGIELNKEYFETIKL